ncbi:MAG TPA: hypothetical protein VFC31_08060 [Candidatus Limnocylindria bacterium]|nr:hypothetical protein [Candidatus Limnocylindria bacterium]
MPVDRGIGVFRGSRAEADRIARRLRASGSGVRVMATFVPGTVGVSIVVSEVFVSRLDAVRAATAVRPGSNPRRYRVSPT